MIINPNQITKVSTLPEGPHNRSGRVSAGVLDPAGAWLSLLSGIVLLLMAACSDSTDSDSSELEPTQDQEGNTNRGVSGALGAGGGSGEKAPVSVGDGGDAAGTIDQECDEPLTRCNGACVDTDKDDAHCGACAIACEAGATCQSGSCVPRCNTRIDCELGEACLDNTCTNLAEGRSWQLDEARDIDYSTRPKVASSITGQTAVVWHANNRLRVSRYGPYSATWSNPSLIHEPDAPYPAEPDVAVDASGNLMTVWHQGGNEFRDAWANRYNADTGVWEGPQPIEPEQNGFSSNVRLVMDAEGNATVVWPHYVEDVAGWVQVNRYHAVTGTWSGVEDLSPQTKSGVEPNLHIAVDPRGNVLVVWSQAPPGLEFSDTFAARFDIDSDKWSPALSINGQNLGHVNHPHVSADVDGNFFAIWHQGGEEVVHVWSNRYDAASGEWGNAEKLDDATGSEGARHAEVAADDHGNCLAIWQQESRLMSALYDADSSSWSRLGFVSDERGVVDPHLVADRGGNGIAIWHNGRGMSVNHFDPRDKTWGPTQRIDPVHANRASSPYIAIDPQGRATAAWHEIGTSDSWTVLTNRFE